MAQLKANGNALQGVVYGRRNLPFSADFRGNLKREGHFGSVGQIKPVNLRTVRGFHLGREKSLGCDNGKHWNEIFESAGKAGIGLVEKLKGKPLLDLGCGREHLASSFRFAVSVGASVYVGVDLDLPNEMTVKRRVEKERSLEIEGRGLKITLVEAEMLCFLKCVPAKSRVNIMMNGVNSTDMHLPEGFDRNTFAIRIAEQMERIVEPDGIVFGMSLVPASFLSEGEWQIFRPEGRAYTFAVRTGVPAQAF